MGMVALFWMRMYKPLIENALPQMPISRRDDYDIDHCFRFAADFESNSLTGRTHR
jgi:hypothetical protein